MRYILLILLFSSCTRMIYVPVESNKIEYRDNYTRDSIYIRDSIYVHGSNDTVFFEKYRLIYKDRFIRDSLFICDTIRVPYPVEKIVYKRQKVFDKIIIILVLLSVLVLLIRFFHKK